MRVTKAMLHPNLRPNYNKLRLVRALFHNRAAIGAVDYALGALAKRKRPHPLHVEEQWVPSGNSSHRIRTLICKPAGPSNRLPLLIYFHGGGYTHSVPDASLHIVAKFLEVRPCVVVAPDYRKAFRHPYPAGFNDCYDVVVWALDNANQLGLEPGNIILGGHSAGGGLAAAVALKARDTGDFSPRFQMPLYPMIDYRQPLDPDRYIDSPVWDTYLNARSWNAYLKDVKARCTEIPSYASPALNRDCRRLPPTLTFVGDIDPFLHETREYVERLGKDRVAVTYKEFPGCYHGFEQFDPKAAVSISAQNFLAENFASLYDTYCQ